MNRSDPVAQQAHGYAEAPPPSPPGACCGKLSSLRWPDLLQDPVAIGTGDMENADRSVGDLPATRAHRTCVPADFLYDFFMGDHDHPLTC